MRISATLVIIALGESIARAMFFCSSWVMMVAEIFMVRRQPAVSIGASMKQSRKIASASHPSFLRPGPRSVVS